MMIKIDYKYDLGISRIVTSHQMAFVSIINQCPHILIDSKIFIYKKGLSLTIPRDMYKLMVDKQVTGLIRTCYRHLGISFSDMIEILKSSEEIADFLTKCYYDSQPICIK